MFKITFLGAGSTVFAKNVLGDCILKKELGKIEISVFDIILAVCICTENPPKPRIKATKDNSFR